MHPNTCVIRDSKKKHSKLSDKKKLKHCRLSGLQTAVLSKILLNLRVNTKYQDRNQCLQETATTLKKTLILYFVSRGNTPTPPQSQVTILPKISVVLNVYKRLNPINYCISVVNNGRMTSDTF